MVNKVYKGNDVQNSEENLKFGLENNSWVDTPLKGIQMGHYVVVCFWCASF